MWKISKVKRKDKNSPKESPDTQAKSAEGAENDLNAGSDDKKAVDKTGIVKKVIYAVVSLFLAMLLWGYVLMDQNPDREKTVTNITPTFESGAVADLDTRKLTIYGNISEILQNVNVTVSAPLTDVMRIDANNIAATVSLTDVHEAGTYELEVKATSNIGRVTSVEPSKITVTVDDVIIRNVPVKWDIVGTMPEAYWHDDPSIPTTSIDLEGARTDIENVSSAVCYIDVTGVTSSVNRSIPLKILDNDGNVLSNSIFKRSIPAVNVQMKVLPHKHVNINYELIDREQIPDIYEIQGETLSVSSIDIAAEPDVLAALETIEAAPISVASINETGDYEYILSLGGIPEKAVILDDVDINSIQLTVTVSDRYISANYTNVPISFVNENPEFSYEYSFKSVDITVYGPAKLVGGFVTSDIMVIVNLAGRGMGDYDIDIESKPLNVETFGDMTITFSEPMVHVKIGNRMTTE